MKNKLLSIALVVISGFSYAQIGNFFKVSSKRANATVFENKISLKNPKLYELDIEGLKQTLSTSPKKAKGVKSDIIVSFPVSYTHLDVYKRQGITRRCRFS